MTKKISNKDRKDWKKFIESNEKLENKDKYIKEEHSKKFIEKTIDLHGYTLEESNNKINDFIKKSYQEGVNRIVIITGKGSRSKNKNDPYQSSDLSILKYSIPNYIENNFNLMKIIIKINYVAVNNPNQGSFDITLKKKIKG